MTMTVTDVEDELPPVGDSACPTGLAFGDSDNDGLSSWLTCRGAIEKTDVRLISGSTAVSQNPSNR